MVEGRLLTHLNRPTRRALIAAMAAGVASPSLAQTDSRSLTFNSEGELMRFPGTLNGHPVTIMLDSGAGAVAIDRGMASRIGLASNGKTANAIGLTVNQTVERSVPFTLSFAGVTLNMESAGLVDLSAIAVTGEDIPVILGGALFENLVVEVDFPAHRVTFYKPGTYDAKGARRVELRRGKHGTHHVQVAIEGHEPVWADFDLGSNTPLTMDAAYARSIGILGGRPASTWIASQLGGLITYDVATARSVRIAGVDIANAPFDSTPDWNKDKEASANIGFPLISRLGRILIDYKTESLFVFPGAAAPAPFRKERLGLALAPQEAGGWRVVHAAVGSPGALGGWKAGDQVAAIDGKTSMPTAARRALAAGAPGVKVVLTRAGGETSTLTLADYY